MAYEVYSLEEPPRLLRSLRGGNYFRGADSNLDGQVEIWTDDAAAVDNFEGLRAAQMQFPPTCVLRYEHGRLVDVSSEFTSYFDRIIAKLRAEINPLELQRFKVGAAKSALHSALPTQQEGVTQPLFTVKKRILELVWAYLYSGREKQAWQALAEMWPPGDVERIRSAIMQMRARGIRAQVDTVSDVQPPTNLRHSKVYDSPPESARPIMVRFYPSAGSDDLRGKIRLDLVVDSVGKVWSVKASSRNKPLRNSLKRSAANWKFIPAFFDEHPVASRVRMTVSLEK